MQVVPLFLAAFLILGTAAADADVIRLDQSVTNYTGLNAIVNECCRHVAQTFTAGLNGELVAVAVDVRLNRSDGLSFPLRVGVTRVAGGIPTLNYLADTVVPSGQTLLSNVLLLNRPVRQSAGDVFAIVVNYEGAPPAGAGNGIAVWLGDVAAPYSGGAPFAKDESVGPDFWHSFAGLGDQLFATYVVESAPVPEPGTILLLSAAVLTGVAHRKRLRTT